MSSANPVPETTGLITGEDAFETIHSAGAKTLLRDGFQRLRVADGFSHSRRVAFQLSCSRSSPERSCSSHSPAELRWDSLSDAIIRSVEAPAPGPAGDVFREAFGQGEDAGPDRTPGWTALECRRTHALLIAGTTAFGQVERTANHVYGIEADPTPVREVQASRHS